MGSERHFPQGPGRATRNVRDGGPAGSGISNPKGPGRATRKVRDGGPAGSGRRFPKGPGPGTRVGSGLRPLFKRASNSSRERCPGAKHRRGDTVQDNGRQDKPTTDNKTQRTRQDEDKTTDDDGQHERHANKTGQQTDKKRGAKTVQALNVDLLLGNLRDHLKTLLYRVLLDDPQRLVLLQRLAGDVKGQVPGGTVARQIRKLVRSER